MPTVDFINECRASTSTRARQVSAMFDSPPSEKASIHFRLDFPYDAEPWNVGLIVGPSGSGKSSVLRQVFGEPRELAWTDRSVIDDVAPGRSVQDVTDAFSSVGFNTIPAWMRPAAVLSNGERFRVEVARRLLEDSDPIVIDEFTSVVDRQVAQVGSHAVQKYVRRQGRKFVAVTCHYDVIEWLQPDWVLDMATQQFTRRLLQRRPSIECVIGRVPHSAWRMFAKYHYMSADLHPGARCFGLWANGHLAAFAGVLHFPHPKVRDISSVSRLVTLPDWQGLGLAHVLAEQVGSAARGVGRRLRTYPAHPSLIRSFDKSKIWRLEKRPGTFQPATGATGIKGAQSQRPCAVFEYCGAGLPIAEARALWG